jgi:hypothetical protein
MPESEFKKDEMKKSDFIFLGSLILFFLSFFVNERVYQFYIEFNHDHGYIMAFIKFAVLATLGEVIGLRIKTGHYNQPGFGILPRSIVWGFIGLTIKGAFTIFATGTPVMLEGLGLNNAISAFAGSFSAEKLFVAFCISVALNVAYAPVMMTFHKMMDVHIIEHGGTLSGLFSFVHFKKIFINLNWDVQWSFVFRKTIPFFWIPAHTLTFILPADFQVLFAALLGIALGTILSVASLKGNLKIT